MTVKDVARIAHEVNRAYCLSLGDASQLIWEDAPLWQKKSAVDGVLFHLSNPSASPSASHNKWLEEKLSNGWKWGPVKDAEKKEHPCILDYELLPQEQKAKDFIFKGIVCALSLHCGIATTVE